MKLVLLSASLLVAAMASGKADTLHEHAKLPYASVYQVVTMQFEQIGSITNRTAQFVMSSNLPDVKTEDIALYIDSKSGRIPLTLNPDGTFSLPLRDDLMKENPFIVANQPKGSMKFKAEITLRGKTDPKEEVLIAERRVRYAPMFNIKSVGDQVHHHVAKAIPEYDGASENMAYWLEFHPSSPTNAPVLIHSAGGDVRVNPDHDGIIRIGYDQKLAKENPWVTFPTTGEVRVKAREKKTSEQSPEA